MRSVKQKCAFCVKWFFSNPRVGTRQKTCGSVRCKRQQKRLSQKNWQTIHPTDYQKAQQDWRIKKPDYWKTYRTEHSAYTRRNRLQSKIRWRLARITLQKRIDILQVIEKQMKPWKLPPLCKKEPIDLPALAGL